MSPLNAASTPSEFNTAGPASQLITPSLRRRAACMLYELVILFGVGLVPATLSTLITTAVAPGVMEQLLVQGVGFLCFGIYFVWMWHSKGQTLPMQTWRIRLLNREGRCLTLRQASLRYAVAWLWVAPAVLLAFLAGWSRWQALGAVAAWAVCYGTWALMLPQRQFLHDMICGTRLVEVPH